MNENQNIIVNATSTGYRVRFESKEEEAALNWSSIGIAVVGLFVIKQIVETFLAAH